MTKSRVDLIDGQITCPECEEKFYVRGQIGGEPQLVLSHRNCKGAGARVPLEPISDEKVQKECFEFYRVNRLINIMGATHKQNSVLH